ncbi:MAG: TRAP transporter substrate-binding protein [Oxalobacteraceae bacterium]|nr:TRAP transporter substrate-binding protein [Oxalobacteraceae bacterium]
MQTPEKTMFKHFLSAGAAMLTFCCALPVAAQEILKLNHTDAPAGSRDRAAQLFSRKVAEYTMNRYRVLVFHSGQLGNDVKSLEQLQQGTLDFTVGATGVYASMNKSLNLAALPFLVDGYEQGWQFYDTSTWLKAQFDLLPAKGVRILDTWEAGFRSFTTKTAFNTPDSARGRKMRIYQNDMLRWVVESMGFEAVVKPVTEVYLAIQQGLVDGQENPIDTISSLRFYEVAPFVTLTRHIYSPIPLSISEKTWQRFSPADQKAIKRAAHDATLLSRTEVRNNEERLLIEMQQKGAKVTRPDIAPFRKAVATVYDKARGVYGEDVDLILSDADKVRKIVK